MAVKSMEPNQSMKRRTFLQQSAAAAAVMAVPASGRAARAEARITFGFSTYGLQSLPAVEAIRTLARIGYDAVELTVTPGWDTDSAKIVAATRREIRDALADTGLKLSSLMENLKITADDKDQQHALERLKLGAALAHELAPAAPPLIQTVLGGGRWEQVRDQFARRLEAWVKVAEETRTVIAIKPHRGGGMSRPEEANWLIAKLGGPRRLRMCYDYSHYAFRDMPLEETIRTALPHTAHIAIKDAVEEQGKVRFVNPGAGGGIDYAKLLRLFHAGGYRGDVCVEVSSQVWRTAGYDGVAAAKSCHTAIAPAFERAGVQRGR